MNLSLRFLPEVAEEVKETQAWYESQRLGLGDEFLAQLSFSLLQVQDRPVELSAHYEDSTALPS